MELKLINPNYAATIVKIDQLLPLEGCDNVVGFPIFGYQAIVSKESKVGDIGIIFTAETQLAGNYCFENNLFRDKTLNRNSEVAGYMEPNCRVKAMKFRGHKSSALFMPLDSLSYLLLNTSINELEDKVGTSFDTINGLEICRKYEIFTTRQQARNKVGGKTKVFHRIDNKTFPEHRDTENYFRNKHMYKDLDRVNITQKLHGSSGRFGYVKIRRQLKWYEKLLQKIGVEINNTKYDYIYGSRKVIKNGDEIEGDNTGYYSTDIRKKMMEKYKSSMPKDYIFYGEIIGRSGQCQIQKDYTYDLPEGECELYIYRISIVNEDGLNVDLSMQQVQEFCKLNGLNAVPLLGERLHKDFIAEDFMNISFAGEYSPAVPLCEKSVCDEGVVVRREGLYPYVTKAKSPDFLEKETKDLDKGIVDMESEESL